MKYTANHGMTSLTPSVLSPSFLAVKLRYSPRIMSIGAIIMTLVILTITAEFAISSGEFGMDAGTATTWATSCIVPPTYIPNSLGDIYKNPVACSMIVVYSIGYKNIDIVPKSTTIDTAMAVLCSCALSTGSVANTAAAPHTDAPDAVSIEVSLSILNTLYPIHEPNISVLDNIIKDTKNPSIPTSAICWNVILNP